MKSAGFELDIDTYIKVSRQLQKNRMLGDGVKLYEHMMDSSYKPSDSECNFILQAIARCNTPDLDLMYRVVSKFEESGYFLSKNIYDGIHRSLTSLGKFDKAEEIVARRGNDEFANRITTEDKVFDKISERVICISTKSKRKIKRI